MRRNIGPLFGTVLGVANCKTALVYKNVSMYIVVDKSKKNIVIKCLNNKIEIV